MVVLAFFFFRSSALSRQRKNANKNIKQCIEIDICEITLCYVPESSKVDTLATRHGCNTPDITAEVRHRRHSCRRFLTHAVHVATPSPLHAQLQAQLHPCVRTALLHLRLLTPPPGP